MIAREEREYERADCVSVLSTFAYDSFVSQGFQAERLRSNPLGVSTEMFRAEAGTRAARAGRVRAGTPLRILTVGTFSYRKGILDLLSIAEALRDRMTFTFVGGLVPESAALQNAAAGKITLVDRAPQHELAQHYRAGDIFVFPTIEDGFAAVLLQAAAAGLPILATENCSAKDFIGKGGAGWVLPIRNPGAFIERLVWCDENRTAIAQMAEAPPVSFARNWSEMAAELVEQYHEIRAQDRRQSA
jgi:glycosyltransferase involved in cell wall biosynthesis